MLFSLYNKAFISRVKWKCSNGPSSFDILTDSLISHVWILFNFYIWHLLDVSLSIRFLSLCDKLQLSYRPQPSHSFYIQCSLISQTRSPHRSKPFAKILFARWLSSPGTFLFRHFLSEKLFGISDSFTILSKMRCAINYGP